MDSNGNGTIEIIIIIINNNNILILIIIIIIIISIVTFPLLSIGILEQQSLKKYTMLKGIKSNQIKKIRKLIRCLDDYKLKAFRRS